MIPPIQEHVWKCGYCLVTEKAWTAGELTQLQGNHTGGKCAKDRAAIDLGQLADKIAAKVSVPLKALESLEVPESLMLEEFVGGAQLTLRDHLAGHVLSAITIPLQPDSSIDVMIDRARVCYRMADVMMAIRTSPPLVLDTPEVPE